MRPPGCDKTRIPLSEEAGDAKMMMMMGHHVSKHGSGSNWSTCVPKKSEKMLLLGVRKCGKSCNLRWANHLRPELKQESFTADEEELIIKLHSAIGSRWPIIAQQLPGRTDNEVKNYWNSSLKKKLKEKGIDPITHRPFSHILRDYENIGATSSSSSPIINNNNNRSTTLFVPNYNQHQQPPHHQLGLLAQLQSIKLVTDTSSIASFPSPPPPSSSSSSYSSSSASSASSSSELQSFGWSEFLLEDGGGSSDHDMKEEVELVIKEDEVLLDHENKMMMKGLSVENENEIKDQFEAGEEGSFVEAMLKRDREMYFMEFPQLWEE